MKEYTITDTAGYQPRYELYLSTTETPTNHGFMNFISEMAGQYKRLNGLSGHQPIIDQDAFTDFISRSIYQDWECENILRLPSRYKEASCES